MHKDNGTFPSEQSIINEIATVEAALIDAGVEVLRPRNMPNQRQIFTRDIGFVIDDKFVVANLLEAVRKPEIEGIAWLLEEIPEGQIIRLPKDASIEGGDVLVNDDHVFVGISKRTNWAGYEALKKHFPHKHIHPIELKVTDDPNTNILHLDCTFQPVGDGYAIFYPDGFKETPQIILDLFGPDKIIYVNQEEMKQMFPNIFSISKKKVLVEARFERLIEELEQRNIEVITVQYAETSKLSGLLRCSTLPLLRS
jgi:N-dimethylarginine dimethylaminohydrolase